MSHVMHYSRFGLLTRCGIKVSSRYLTRFGPAVTCKRCAR